MVETRKGFLLWQSQLFCLLNPRGIRRTETSFYAERNAIELQTQWTMVVRSEIYSIVLEAGCQAEITVASVRS
jgi:hypothetical protein